jgi:hypothetical protein
MPGNVSIHDIGESDMDLLAEARLEFASRRGVRTGYISIERYRLRFILLQLNTETERLKSEYFQQVATTEENKIHQGSPSVVDSLRCTEYG